MDKSTFSHLLENNHDRLKNRGTLVSSALDNPEYIAILLSNIENIAGENCDFSARILELVFKENISLLLPYLDRFSELLPNIKHAQTIRASAKICEILVQKYFSVKPPVLQENQVDKIIESGFDWMIAENKTAVKAYTMHTLYIIGTKYNWIHPALISNIEKDIPNGTVGYVNRGRKIIQAIESKTMLKL